MALFAAVNGVFFLTTNNPAIWASIGERLGFMQSRPQAAQIFLLFIVQETLLLAIFLLVFRRWKWRASITQYFRDKFQWKGWWVAVKRSLWGLLVYIFGSAILLSALNYFHIVIPWLFGQQGVMDILEGIPLDTRFDYILLLLLAVVIGPIVEELLFRWFITHTLASNWAWSGVVVAAVLFAVAHMERGVVLNLIVLALFLGYIYRKTGSLRYSLLFHMGINGLAVVAVILANTHPGLVG